MGYIYKITNNINQKKYIGKTERDINIRWQEHLRHIDTLIHLPLYKALKKYGKENFSIEIIEECDNLMLDDREIYWINYYQTYGKHLGYNCTGGGEGGIRVYDEKDLSEIAQRYKNGERLDKLCKEFHYNYTNIRAELAKKGIYVNTQAGPQKLSKKIFALDPETKNIIYEFPSISEASRQICEKGKNPRAISNHISRYKNTSSVSHGFLWRTEDSI